MGSAMSYLSDAVRFFAISRTKSRPKNQAKSEPGRGRPIMLVVASRGPKHKHKHKAPKHSKHKATTTTSIMSGENDVFLKGTGSKSHPPVSSGLRMRDG